MFRKRSVDGSSKADASFTGDIRDRVWGVVYQMSKQDKSALDNYESLGIGYDEVAVDVFISDQHRTRALAYIARQESLDEDLEPYCWYVEFIRHGALHHRLPMCYIQHELSVNFVSDPDVVRRQTNQRLLRGDC